MRCLQWRRGDAELRLSQYSVRGEITAEVSSSQRPSPKARSWQRFTRMQLSKRWKTTRSPSIRRLSRQASCRPPGGVMTTGAASASAARKSSTGSAV
jgi:hypothetical protein